MSYARLRIVCLICLLLATGAPGQLQYPGPCHVDPEQTDQHVDILGLLGPWFQQNRIANRREHGVCSTTSFFVGNLETGMVINREFSNGYSRYWNGTITKDDDDRHKYIVTYDGETYEYYFLSANYKEYVLIYSCQSSNDFTYRNVWGWLLSRAKNYKPSPQSIKEIRVALELNPDLNVTWTHAHQKDCRD